MAKKTVAHLLVDTLVAAGVKRVYGLAGDSTGAAGESGKTGGDK
jgi:thiamine pyrophosphate-dependent acetolactate synthase large subunit-like protein